MDNKFFEELKEKIQAYFEKGGSHSFDHTQRVYNLALKISKGEKADLDVVRAAALLHDISRLKEDNKKVKCHAEDGSIVAKRILEQEGFPEDKIEKVCYCIKVHRHSKNIKAETKEAEILQDADRLDALGAITVGRMFSSGGKIGIPLYKPQVPLGKVLPDYDSESTIHGFYAKILRITPDVFNTKIAKHIAKERYKFVEEFLDRFMKEWEGEL